jgi:hypothetical protein
MSTESWLFIFAAIPALGTIAAFFRLDALVIWRWLKPSPGRRRSPATGREKFMALMTAVSFAVAAYGVFVTRPQENYIMQWGATGPYGFVRGDPASLRGARASHLLVDGGKLGAYAGKYRLMAIAFHHKITGDVLDDPNLSKSGLYDVEPEQIWILIPWSGGFIADLVDGWHPTRYELLAVPIGVQPEQFETLRQVVALGAVRLDRKGGPP